MNDKNISSGLVETLRSITEKDDLKKYLKSTLGGYTKGSVQDYLGELRRQQQASAEIFTQNQQTLFEEKEKLRQENETLKTLLTKTEAEYENLSAAMLAAGDTAVSGNIAAAGDNAAELAELSKRCAALEEELKRAAVENSRLESHAKLQKDTMENDALKLREASQEIQSLQETLRAERLESKKTRSEVARLSGMIGQKSEEIEFLRRTISESELIDLRSRISALTEQLTTQTRFVAACNSENELKAKTIQTLAGENESLKQDIEGLTRSLEDLRAKNDCLRMANSTLTNQLESEYKRAISLIMEKSGTTVDKLAADRKLEEANTRIMMLELKLRDLEGSKAAAIVYEYHEKTGEVLASRAAPVAAV